MESSWYWRQVGNHQAGDRAMWGMHCIYCSRLQSQHNIDHPNDLWDPGVVYLQL